MVFLLGCMGYTTSHTMPDGGVSCHSHMLWRCHLLKNLPQKAGGVGIELRHARLASTFPQAPLRSRTVGFPEYGSDPGFPLKVFPNMRKLKRWLASTPLIAGLPAGSPTKTGSSDSRR